MRVPTALAFFVTAFCSQWLLVAASLHANLQPAFNDSFSLSLEDPESDTIVAGVYIVQFIIGSQVATVQTIIPSTTISCTPSCTTTTFQPTDPAIVSDRQLFLDVLWAPQSPGLPASLMSLPPQFITLSSTPGSLNTAIPSAGQPGVQLSGAPSPTTSVSASSLDGSSETSAGSNGAGQATSASSPNTGTSNTSGVELSTSGGGLSTGAKIGIAVGAVGAFLIILIIALLLWRRGRRRRLKTPLGGTMGYTDDRGSSMNRDLTAEKDMQILNSPVGAYASNETRQGQAYTDARSPEPQQPPRADAPSPVGSWARNEQRGSYDAVHAESHVPPQVPTPPAAAMASPGAAAAAAAGGASAFSRKPVAGPTTLFQEPGMSDEEVARLEEEERRIDEAIAEAERRRQ